MSRKGNRRYGYGAVRIQVMNNLIPDHVILHKLQTRGKRDDNGCLIWQGETTVSHGMLYGMVATGSMKGRSSTERVHRVAYRMLVGPLEEGKVILHKCNNSLCYEVTHLYQGTQADNIRDSIEAGTHVSVNPDIQFKG